MCMPTQDRYSLNHPPLVTHPLVGQNSGLSSDHITVVLFLSLLSAVLGNFPSYWITRPPAPPTCLQTQDKYSLTFYSPTLQMTKSRTLRSHHSPTVSQPIVIQTHFSMESHVDALPQDAAVLTHGPFRILVTTLWWVEDRNPSLVALHSVPSIRYWWFIDHEA